MSIFKGLFSKQLKEPVNLGALQTDFHSHLIPGIDDGVATMEDALEVVRKFKELGYKKLITTPHVMTDYFRNDSDTINRGAEEVRAALSQHKIDMQFEAAAEYYLDEHLEQLVADKNLLTLGDGYVLFELSFLMEPPNLSRLIFDMQMAGYKPILAHPERYQYWHKQWDKYQELRDKGVHLQLNMLSLTGHYSPQIKKVAQRMLDEGLVDFAGSDCHRIQHLQILEHGLTNPYFRKLVDNVKNAELS